MTEEPFPVIPIPSAIACPGCAATVPLAVTARVTAGAGAMIELAADVPTATRALVDHVMDVHERPSPEALGAWVTEQAGLALASARVLVEEMLAMVGMVPSGHPGRFVFPDSLWESGT